MQSCTAAIKALDVTVAPVNMSTVISVIAVSLKVTVTSKAPFLPCAVAVYISTISAKHKIVVDNT